MGESEGARYSSYASCLTPVENSADLVSHHGSADDRVRLEKEQADIPLPDVTRRSNTAT